MKTETINLYRYSELSDEAKERALDDWRAHNYEINWQDELFDSLKTLIERSGFKLSDYSLGLERSYIRLDMPDEIAVMEGPRAMAWIENNLLSNLRISPAQYKAKGYAKYGKAYRVGCIKPCPFTGVCYDEDFLDSLLANIRQGYCLKDCYNWLANKYQELLDAEYEYQTSEEYIAETFEANDYHFTEDGTLWC